MGTLWPGGECWRVLDVSDRFRGPKGDQHGLRSQELDPLSPDLAAWPIAPAYRLKRNRRREMWSGWRLTACNRCAFRLGDRRRTPWRRGNRRGDARPKHRAHSTRLEGSARFLTLFA